MYNELLNKVKEAASWDLFDTACMERACKLADKVVWAWKWRKINEKEKDDLCQRVTAIFEGDYYDRYDA